MCCRSFDLSVFFGSDFPDRPCDQAQGELCGKRVSFKTTRPEEVKHILDFDCQAVARSRSRSRSPTSRARSSWPCVCVVRKTHTRSSQVACVCTIFTPNLAQRSSSSSHHPHLSPNIDRPQRQSCKRLRRVSVHYHKQPLARGIVQPNILFLHNNHEQRHLPSIGSSGNKAASAC